MQIFPERLKTWERTLFCALLAIVFLPLVARLGVHWVTQNYNLAAESNGLFGLLEVADGKPLFPERGTHPYQVYLYGPLHAEFFGVLLRIFGIKGLSNQVIFIKGASFLCLLGALILLWSTFRNRITAFGFLIALLLGSSKFADYATTTRNDMFSLLFEAGIMCSFVQWLRTQKKNYLLLFLLLSFLSPMVRQLGLVAFGAGILFLFYRRKWKDALVLGTLIVIGVGSVFWTLNSATHGVFLEDFLFSNLRGFRPTTLHFVDKSLVSFVLGYIVFVFLVLRGIGISLKEKKPEEIYLLFVLLLATGLALSLLLRAGGDVNYFFEAIYVGFFFCALGAEWGLEALRKRPAVVMSILSLQALLIGSVYGFKAHSAYLWLKLPFQEASENLRERFPGLILFSGYFGPNLSVHLREQAFHGPDVTNASMVAKNGSPKLRWILRDLENAILSEQIKTAVIAEKDCERYGGKFGIELPMDATLFENFEFVEKPYPWLCVFQRRG